MHYSIEHGRCGNTSLQESSGFRPSSIQAMRRGSNTPRYVVLYGALLNANSCFRAGLRQEDPPNLNILLSGGKETNKDSLSNGE